jgi:hypothetical protein
MEKYLFIIKSRRLQWDGNEVWMGVTIKVQRNVTGMLIVYVEN